VSVAARTRWTSCRSNTWEGRYNDPDRTWRTLYLASDAYGAWVEVLGRFRPTTT